VISFDSNILVYAVDRDAGERHRRATDLIERGIRARNCIQPLQTLAEFFHVATRKIGIEPRKAAAFVEGWHAVIPIEASTIDDLADAIRVVIDHGLSFWDAMLWATARRAGALFLLSEDLQDGRTIEGVRIVNPFAARNQAIVDQVMSAP
jgi:predicted nucleic acid-binding protein